MPKSVGQQPTEGCGNETVFVCTAGEYSDYRLVGIYETKELAEDCRSKLGYDGNDVREMEVLTTAPRRVTVHIRIAWHKPPDRSPQERAELLWPWDYGYESRRLVVEQDNKDRLIVKGTSKSAVDKAFQDRLAKRRAIMAGIADE